MEITINGVNYKQESITINVVPYVFDPMKEKIRYLKSMDIQLCYGGGDFPVSISFPNDKPKGYYCEHLRMLGINTNDINRIDWFK